MYIVYVCISHCVGTCGSQQGVLDPLYLGLQVIGCCESTDMELNSGPPEEQEVLSAAEHLSFLTAHS